jgi:NDP-sugar pyrophosphorylase family protein
VGTLALSNIPRSCAQVVTVDVKAIVLIAGPAAGTPNGMLPDVAPGLLPVVGRPVVSHVIDQLLRAGIDGIAVISEPAPAPFLRAAQRAGIKWLQAADNNGSLWRTAESAFKDFAQRGAELVLALRVGAYTELDVERLVQFHLDRRNRVTAVEDEHGPLDMFVISASRRNDAAYMFRHKLAGLRSPAGKFEFTGYANRLANAHDLRRLATDILAFKTRIVPAGREIKPGVWVEDGARIHHRARILAPAFVGAHSKIRAAVVLTRGAVIEHHSEIDCGTVVEDTSVLPYTYVGAGLDLAHAVAGFRSVIHLRRDVAVEINDPKLLGRALAAAPLRALAAAASLAGFLPRQFLRGLFAPSQREPLTELPAAVQSPSAALQSPAATGLESAAAQTDPAKFPANLVVARRYGDQ